MRSASRAVCSTMSRKWAKANPALGSRIDVDTIRDERVSMSSLEFARERLGWWDEPSAGQVIPGPGWAACACR